MKAMKQNELKKELNDCSKDRLMELCLRLSRFKKENKELLTYLLVESENENNYVNSVKQEMDSQMESLNKSNLYLAKKTIRKILRTARKYIRYSDNKSTEMELMIHFCSLVKNADIPIHESVVLTNLLKRQLLKTEELLGTLHEDLQYDFKRQLEILNKG
jgi:hypothetical protein